MFELPGERPAGSEEQRLESGRCRAEDVRYLAVRAALELAKHDRLALLGRDLRESGQELADARTLVVRLRARDVLVELHLSRSRLLLTEALLDRVARDCQQPVRRLPRTHALFERAVGIQERRLGYVLRVCVVAEDGVRVAIDLCPVLPVEVVHCARGDVRRFGGGHPSRVVSATRYDHPTGE